MTIREKEKLGRSELILEAFGIPRQDVPDVLRCIGLELLERDIYAEDKDDRQSICTALCDTLRLTGNAGDPNGNPHEHLIYVPGEEIVRPIFKNGNGRNGYYDINVAGDSGTAMICDIVNNFVRRVW